MKSIFNLLLLSTLFLTSPLLSQFSKNDSLLIHKTFTRDWNDKIFYDYLVSEDEKKINSALLALSHSGDTSFVQSIVKIENRNCIRYIFFALGQIGFSFQSVNYLWQKIESGAEPNIYYAFEALGKIGSTDDFNLLLALVEKEGISSGIPTAFVNFHIRGIKDAMIAKLIWDKFYKTDDQELLKEISYALYRTRQPIDDISKFESRFKEILQNETNISTVQYLLGVCRNNKIFFSDEEVLLKLCSHENWIVRNETASSAAYFKFTASENLTAYLRLLEDDNPNVQRTCAFAIKNISSDQNLLTQFLSKIQDHLTDKRESKFVYGELLNSYLHLTSDKKNIFFSRYKNYLTKDYIAKIFGEHTEFDSVSTQELFEIFKSPSIATKIETVTALTKIYKRNKSESIRNFIFEQLQSEYPPLVSIAADDLDSLTIAIYSNELKTLSLRYVKENLNSTDHLEAILSLYNLSEKISNDFQTEIKNLFTHSEVFSLSKIANPSAKKITQHFSKIWEYSFKYSTAVVRTTKGEFTLQLQNGIAPITAANFCMLAENKFYDGIIFHRVVPAFVIQGGDPTGSGWGGCGYEIVSEFSPENYSVGAAGIASAGKDTEGSQWFIMQAEHKHLNGRYTIWAKIISGQNVVDSIEQEDSIISIKLH